MATYSIYELPFTAMPQLVSVRLVGVQYRFKLAWNIPANCWVMDILNPDESPIARGIPLVTGADLLAQFEYLNIKGQMLVVTDQTTGTDLCPNFTNLGVTGHVYFLPDGSQPLPGSLSRGQ